MKLAVLLAAQLVGVLTLSTNFRQENSLEQVLLLAKEIPVTTTIVSVDVPLPIGVGGNGGTGVKHFFPVPTAARCVVIVTITYMSILAALAITRAYHDMTETARGQTEAALKACFQTLTYGPMVCVLFIAYRMHVESLSDGLDDPQIWGQCCMYAVTFAVVANALCVLVVPLTTAHQAAITEETPRVLAPMDDEEHKCTSRVISCLRFVILVSMFGGLVGVMVGMLIYTPPQESDLSKLPPPAPPVLCTMIITSIFFVTWVLIAVLRSIHEFTGRDTSHLESMASGVAVVMEYGPMLCILFLAARMRAGQHDSQPQQWAAYCMFAATGSLALTTAQFLLVPLLHGGEVEVTEGHDVKMQASNCCVGVLMTVIRYVTMLGFYGGAAGVAVSIILFESPKGPEYTMAISPTVQCVIILSALFFAVYILPIMMKEASDLSQGRVPMETYSFYYALDAAKSTVQFAPMLAILFVTVRMYALLITEKKGAPQRWVQDAMFISTWSLVISMLACIATGITKGKIEQDEDGYVVNKFENKTLAVSMINVRALCMIMFYGGVVATIIGLLSMTEGTANGKGRIPVISEAVEVVRGKRFLFPQTGSF